MNGEKEEVQQEVWQDLAPYAMSGSWPRAMSLCHGGVAVSGCTGKIGQTSQMRDDDEPEIISTSSTSVIK